MGKLKAYLDLCRVGNLPTVWTNVLAAGLLATGSVDIAYFLLLAAALSCFYLAGMSLNDLCDVEIDRQRRPGRPIVAGRVGVGEARGLTAGLILCGFVLLLLAPDPAGLPAAVALLVAIVAYDLRHKGNPYSVLLMASCRFLVFVVTSLALTGGLPGFVLLAGAVQFTYIVGLSLFARWENARAAPLPFPAMPLLLAAISLVDGLVIALLVSPVWLWAGVAGAAMTLLGQKLARGD